MGDQGRKVLRKAQQYSVEIDSKYTSNPDLHGKTGKVVAKWMKDGTEYCGINLDTEVNGKKTVSLPSSFVVRTTQHNDKPAKSKPVAVTPYQVKIGGFENADREFAWCKKLNGEKGTVSQIQKREGKSDRCYVTLDNTDIIKSIPSFYLNDAQDAVKLTKPNTSPLFTPGAEVTLHSLTAAMLNGEKGKVTKATGAEKWDRWDVRLHNEKVRLQCGARDIAVKGYNLKLTESRRLGSIEASDDLSVVQECFVGAFLLLLMFVVYLFTRRVTAPKAFGPNGTRIVRKKAPTFVRKLL